MNTRNCIVTVTGNLFVRQAAPYDLPITITSDSVDLTTVVSVEVEWITPAPVSTTILWTALDPVQVTPSLLVVSHLLAADGSDVPRKGLYHGLVNLLMPAGGPRWCYSFSIPAIERIERK